MKNLALLIIDMQKGSFTPKTPRFDTEGVVSRINKVSSECRKRNIPVFVIQHDGTGTGEFEKYNGDWENIDELEVKESDYRIDKYANDVFYKSVLHRELQKEEITQLLITGCATDFCVESTIQSTLTKDYDVVVIEDGHTTGDRPHLKAEKIIEHYNWIWNNMIPTAGSVCTKKTAEVIHLLDQN